MPSKLAILACLFLVVAPAHGQQERRPPGAASKQAAQDQALLRQMAEAQKWVGEQTWHIRDGIERLHAEMAEERDRDTALDGEVKALREEVKGLYVENSTLKQELEALKEDIAGVNSNISSFRTISGLFIAVMILLLGGLFLVTSRR
jgi:septal ring factor EnvC (AmiA/AmiB activator)